jgi:hypothetical protein
MLPFQKKKVPMLHQAPVITDDGFSTPNVLLISEHPLGHTGMVIMI